MEFEEKLCLSIHGSEENLVETKFFFFGGGLLLGILACSCQVSLCFDFENNLAFLQLQFLVA